VTVTYRTLKGTIYTAPLFTLPIKSYQLIPVYTGTLSKRGLLCPATKLSIFIQCGFRGRELHMAI
jgi:hypothetical protein